MAASFSPQESQRSLVRDHCWSTVVNVGSVLKHGCTLRKDCCPSSKQKKRSRFDHFSKKMAELISSIRPSKIDICFGWPTTVNGENPEDGSVAMLAYLMELEWFDGSPSCWFQQFEILNGPVKGSRYACVGVCYVLSPKTVKP